MAGALCIYIFVHMISMILCEKYIKYYKILQNIIKDYTRGSHSGFVFFTWSDAAHRGSKYVLRMLVEAIYQTIYLEASARARLKLGVSEFREIAARLIAGYHAAVLHSPICSRRS